MNALAALLANRGNLLYGCETDKSIFLVRQDRALPPFYGMAAISGELLFWSGWHFGNCLNLGL
jgi:hypothetical protein